MMKACLVLAALMYSVIVYAADWKTTQSEFGYSFVHPSDWTVGGWTDEDFWQHVESPDKTAKITIIWGFLADSNSPIGENALDEIIAAKIIPQLANNFKDIKISGQNKATLGNKEVTSFVFKGEPLHPEPTRDPGTKKMYLFIEGRLYYALYYSAHNDTFTKYVPVLDQMMQSFQPIPSAVVDQGLQSMVPPTTADRLKE
jgi:hypothetical protein